MADCLSAKSTAFFYWGGNESMKRNAEINPGYVYAIERPDGVVKIGKTTNPEGRLKTIEMQAGFLRSRSIVSDRINYHDIAEMVLHAEFIEHRFIGEWFETDYNAVHSFISSKPWEREFFKVLVSCREMRSKPKKTPENSSSFDVEQFFGLIKRLLPNTIRKYAKMTTTYKEVVEICGLRSERVECDHEWEELWNSNVRLYDKDVLVFEGRDYPDSIDFMERVYGLSATDETEFNENCKRMTEAVNFINSMPIT
jgi:hypothetical protein